MENLVQLYMGEGKGKTTASMGLALRALGQGRRVLVAQFLKNGTTGELVALAQLPGVTIVDPIEINKFTYQMTQQELEQTALQHQQHLAHIAQMVHQQQPGLLVLDEMAVAMSLNLVDREDAMALIEQGIRYGEVVVTGRYAPDYLMERADYISELVKRKHPYDRGVQARRGIEF